ncbi:TonB-dependent receptor domain-containing protein [Rugamonas sp. DEMB1]|uniref:TonB-dependent receptor domain-containing protein n=1 Tax=Rugamonas sp. DEMB1 TaxID=3039386 RepID=UPI0024486C7F|nr:TonB-dependent receptor [Rugamonas sp. DEMB1]WGG49784.1 TonB-dependent receptor [Rugamonas sp. DEMB1]
MTVFVSRHAALSSLALALAVPSALAQSANTAPLNNVLVTATRTPQLASDILSDTLSIDAEQIAQSGAGSLVDLLQRQRGIQIARNGGPGTNSTVYIRGANGNQNIVLVDGVRIGSATSGAASWSAIPLTAVDHIEIVYGPLSTLYGADAIGGVIQIFTKKGQGAPALSASVGYGSDNTRQIDAGISGATGGEHALSYALSAGKEKSDGFSSTLPASSAYNPDRDGYQRDNAAGQVGLQLAKGHELGAQFLTSRLDFQYDSGKSAFDTRSQQKLQNLALYSKNQILPIWSSLVQLSESRDKSFNATGTTAKERSQIDTKQTDLTWQNDVRVGADMLQLLYGHRKEQVESTLKETERERTTTSLAASYNMKRGDHLVNLGLRNDDSSQYGGKTTGAAGYGYRINGALRASASYGTSFRAPTFNELYYPAYGTESSKPEKGRNAELGLHYSAGATQLNAVYFHNRLTDLLVSTSPCLVSTVDPKKYPSCVYNVNHALLEGLSLSASRQLGAFGLNGNIDLLNARDESTGKSLARRAKKHANFAADYSAGALKAGVELELAGERFDDSANKTRLGGYGLVNLFATYRINADWSALVRWNNLADKQYEVARNYAASGAKLFAAIRYGYK